MIASQGESSGLHMHCRLDAPRAVVIVHGRAGYETSTSLRDHLCAHPELHEWSVYTFRYPTALTPRPGRFFLPMLSPGLLKVAGQFATSCQSRLSRYGSLGIVGHCTGGLVAQRALLESEWLRDRTTHVALLAAPSNGLRWSWIPGLVSPQIRDLWSRGKFIRDLRRGDRVLRQGDGFVLRVIAATHDGLVPESSVFEGFPADVRRMASGHHVSMVESTQTKAAVVNLLSNRRVFLSYAREDQAAVLKVRDELERRELAPWVDVKNIDSGRWEDTVMNAIRTSDRFLVFLSRSSVKKLKTDDILKRELIEALSVQQAREPAPFIVPVRLEHCALPDSVKAFQSYDLFSNDVEELAKMLEKSTRNPT